MRDDKVEIRVKLLSPDARIPETVKPGDVAFDLFSVVDYDLEPGNRFPVPTGPAMEIPTGYEGQIRSRSGLAFRKGLATLNTPGTTVSVPRALRHRYNILKSDKALRFANFAELVRTATRRLIEELENEERKRKK